MTQAAGKETQHNKRTIGNKYETIAAMYLKQSGYDILCRNYRLKCGEIDIIARDGACLSFVEVKYRSKELYGTPAEAVDVRKQKKIIQVAEQFIYRNEERLVHIFAGFPEIRFDVVEVRPDHIRLLKNAFGYGTVL